MPELTHIASTLREIAKPDCQNCGAKLPDDWGIIAICGKCIDQRRHQMVVDGSAPEEWLSDEDRETRSAEWEHNGKPPGYVHIPNRTDIYWERWRNMVPATYQESFDRHNPNASKRMMGAAKQWLDGPPEKGLGIVGPHGTCKTRLAYRILGLLTEPRKISDFECCTSMQFADLALRSAGQSDARLEIESYRCAKFLLLDDVGKEPETKSNLIRTKLLDLFEFRGTSKMITIWTSNFGKDQLAEKIGPATARRMFEYNQVIESGGIGKAI